MRKSGYFFLLLALCISCSEEKGLSEKRELSECLGDLLWESLKDAPRGYDLEMVIETIRKHFEGKREVEGNSRIRLAKIAEIENEKQAAIALERAESYLQGAAADGGVCVLKPGKLLYRVLSSGAGVGSREVENPLLHLVEKDLDGEILYDSYETSCPIRLSLDEAVLGLKLGVMGMKVGERREIIVHPDLAYKKLGKTKPNQLMIYDVTLIEN